MIIEIVVGDAYGACFECIHLKLVEENNDLIHLNAIRNPLLSLESLVVQQAKRALRTTKPF
jgi:hypothetical protein